MHLQPIHTIRPKRELVPEVQHGFRKVRALWIRSTTVVPATTAVEVHREPDRLGHVVRALEEPGNLAALPTPLSNGLVVPHDRAFPYMERREFILGGMFLQPLRIERELRAIRGFVLRDAKHTPTSRPHLLDGLTCGRMHRECRTLHVVPSGEHLWHTLCGEFCRYTLALGLPNTTQAQQRSSSLSACRQVPSIMYVRPRLGRAVHSHVVLGDHVPYIVLGVAGQELFDVLVQAVLHHNPSLTGSSDLLNQPRLKTGIDAELPDVHHVGLREVELNLALHDLLHSEAIHLADMPAVRGGVLLHLVVDALHVHRIHGLSLTDTCFEFVQLPDCVREVLHMYVRGMRA